MENDWPYLVKLRVKIGELPEEDQTAELSIKANDRPAADRAAAQEATQMAEKIRKNFRIPQARVVGTLYYLRPILEITEL